MGLRTPPLRYAWWLASDTRAPIYCKDSHEGYAGRVAKSRREGLAWRRRSFPAPDRFPLTPGTGMGENGSRDVDKAETIVEVIGGQK